MRESCNSSHQYIPRREHSNLRHKSSIDQLDHQQEDIGSCEDPYQMQYKDGAQSIEVE